MKHTDRHMRVTRACSFWRRNRRGGIKPRIIAGVEEEGGRGGEGGKEGGEEGGHATYKMASLTK